MKYIKTTILFFIFACIPDEVVGRGIVQETSCIYADMNTYCRIALENKEKITVNGLVVKGDEVCKYLNARRRQHSWRLCDEKDKEETK